MKHKWILRTTNNIGKGKRPKHPYMWVSATCTTKEIAADHGEGLNFLVVKNSWYWVMEQWVEDIEELPEFSNRVFNHLFRSFWGELEVEIEDGDNNNK